MSAASTSASRSFGDCKHAPIDSARWNAAVYAQARDGRPAAAFALTTGVRVEDNQRFGTYVTYRLGAVYRLAGGTRLRATVGTGFREPSFFENYSTGFTVGNPDLQPEPLPQLEVGLEQSWPGTGRASRRRSSTSALSI